MIHVMPLGDTKTHAVRKQRLVEEAYKGADKLVQKPGTPLVGVPGTKSTLTREQATEIRRRRIAGESSTALAEEFGVSINVVFNSYMGMSISE